MIRVRQIKISIEKDSEIELKHKITTKLNTSEKNIQNIKITKKSLDARQKPNLYYIYEVDVKLNNEQSILKHKVKDKDIFLSPKEEYILPNIGDKNLFTRPIIIGSGPAGLFCAYLLAELGYRPLIIERGEPVEKRVETVESFWKTGKLNKDSNVQFGEGGAGTFSDGKLNTLVKDKDYRMKKVFEIFVSCGANPEIMYIHNPHIGTDVLRTVVKKMRDKIIGMGGTFQYNSCLTNIEIENGIIKAIEINHQEKIETDILVLAIGHSARDTFEILLKNNLSIEPKPFAMGIRIQHSQKLINKSQYGIESHPKLPSASYKLTYKSANNRGVYSFCMCPGGYVVNASSEEGRLAINGMSESRRDSENANSAIVVTIGPADYGKNPLDGMIFQRKLEEKAYQLGKGNIPIQLWKDFKENKQTTKLGSVKPIFKGNFQLTNLNELFPEYINSALKEAIPNFNKKIKGFSDDNSILAGIESRTSSPVRIPRDENFQSNIKGIYPCGEGAGYAGGITTSAIDGLKIAESIAHTYSNKNKFKNRKTK